MSRGFEIQDSNPQRQRRIVGRDIEGNVATVPPTVRKGQTFGTAPECLGRETNESLYESRSLVADNQ